MLHVRNLEHACALMASDSRKTFSDLEFKKNGKANNTLLALDVFLTVLTLTEVLANSRAKLLRFFSFKDDADLVFTAAILPLEPSVGCFIQRVL